MDMDLISERICNGEDVAFHSCHNFIRHTLNVCIPSYYRESRAAGVHARVGHPHRRRAHPLCHRACHHPRAPAQVQVQCGCEQEEVFIVTFLLSELPQYTDLSMTMYPSIIKAERAIASEALVA